MSESLVKIVDLSLIPASILIVFKFVGLILVSYLTGINLEFASAYDLLNTSLVGSLSDQVILVAYSDLVMYLAVSAIFTWFIIKAVFFHKTHVNPRTVLKLANMNFLNMIQNSFEIYHSGVVWAIFTIGANFLIWANIVQGKSFIAIGIITTLITATQIVVLVQDAYKEIEYLKKHSGKIDWYS